MNKENVNATTYTYGGGSIPFIRKRLPIIKSNNASPKNIILQAGGNDCAYQSLDRVKKEYEGLVNDVKYLWPSARVIISTVPPRKTSVETKLKIAGLNENLKSMNDPAFDLYCTDFSPKTTRFYGYKRVHFNMSGVKYYAGKVAEYLSNFHASQTNTTS